MLVFSLTLSGSLALSLGKDVVMMLQKTYAESTKASYRTHLKSYSAFCVALGVDMVPAQPRTVALYAALLARTLQYGSIVSYMNIVSLLHKSLAVKSPLESFMVKCCMRGIKNTIGNDVVVKLPVTPQILYDILKNFDHFERSRIQPFGRHHY